MGGESYAMASVVGQHLHWEKLARVDERKELLKLVG